MALEWDAPKTSKVKFSVAVTDEGNIAQSEDTAAGTKDITIKGVATGANFSNTNRVYSSFVTGLAGGRYDKKSGKKIVEYSVTGEED